MKYMKLIGALFASVMLATVVAAAPTTNAPSGDTLSGWTVSLSGQGASALNGSKLSHSAIGGELELGHDGKFVLPLNAGVRQGVGYSDGDGASWVFSTKVYSDWTVVRLGNLQLDAGVNAGASYGNQPLTWTAAPELVGRLYLKKDVDVFSRVEYPFDLNKGRAQNSLIYTLGVRVGF